MLAEEIADFKNYNKLSIYMKRCSFLFTHDDILFLTVTK